MRDIIAGTAGHIDHGKSSLVLALTGTDPDRLEEEKRRGITIDLGFAHLELPGGVRVAFVDVPGHERFVRNMLAGVTGIDFVILVVAADESIKPQTREHFEICKLLEIERGLVAITKSDLVDAELLETVRAEIHEFVAGSFLEGAAVIPVSARTGAGLDDLRTELARLSLASAARPVDLPFRLPIDRAFVMKGFGTVVTGTLAAGIVDKEAEAELFPERRRVRVRGIEVHNQLLASARAGQRTALNLSGIEVQDVSRGMVLAAPGLFENTDRLDCSLVLLDTARPLKHRSRVHFHCGTAETLAEVVLIDGGQLRPGERSYAQLRLATPGLFLPGDRFIIRQFSPVTTIGGGAILDSQPPRHRLGDPAVRERFRRLEGDAESRIETLVGEAGEASVEALVARTGLKAEDVLRHAQNARWGPGAAEKGLMLLGRPVSGVAHPAHFAVSGAAVLRILESFHAQNPLVRGLAKEDLRGRLAVPARARSTSRKLPSPTLLNAILQALANRGTLEVEGELVRLAGREIRLSPEESAAKERISGAFERSGLQVPPAAEVLAKLTVDRARAEKIFQILLREKTLVRVAEGLVFHRAALEKLRALVAQRKVRSPQIDVTAFKEMTGLTRKYAIPLLEYLDRERVTRRQGEVRIIL